MQLNVQAEQGNLNMYTPQQVTGFEKALEKARTERDRYNKKLDQLAETITGFENLLKEIKRETK